jgi:hypothetical protein
MLWINPDSTTDIPPAPRHMSPELLPLRERIEYHMVRILQDLLKFIRPICRRIHMNFTSELLKAEASLIQGTRSRPLQHLLDLRECAEHGKPFQSKENLDPCSHLDLIQSP